MRVTSKRAKSSLPLRRRNQRSHPMRRNHDLRTPHLITPCARSRSPSATSKTPGLTGCLICVGGRQRQKQSPAPTPAYPPRKSDSSQRPGLEPFLPVRGFVQPAVGTKQQVYLLTLAPIRATSDSARSALTFISLLCAGIVTTVQ